MSINLQAEMLDIDERQRYLRSLARPGRPTVVRLWTGRHIVRLGRWLEGRRSEEISKPAPVGPLPRLAGGHR